MENNDLLNAVTPPEELDTGDQTDVVEDQDPTTEPETPQQPEQKDNNNSVIKQLRDEIKRSKANETRITKLLEKIGGGASLEELEQKYQLEEDKKIATEKGIPTEIQSRMREQEARIKQLEEQNIAYNFNSRANQLMISENLNQQQFLEFAESAKNSGIDILKPNVDLQVVYRAINYDRLTKELVAKTKQEVLSGIEQQRLQSSSPGSIKQSVPPKQNNNNDDLDEKSFVDSIFEKFK